MVHTRLPATTGGVLKVVAGPCHAEAKDGVAPVVTVSASSRLAQGTYNNGGA